MSRSIKLLLAMSLIAVVLIPVAAVASHQFTDVPDSNIFHADITWVADNGVTKGCNPPTNTKYCPSDNVTREQMAAFMHRLAVNKVVDAKTATTADNADTLDGKDSTDFLGATATAVDSDKLDGLDSTEALPIMFGQSDANQSGTTKTAQGMLEVNSRTFAVPDDGFLTISGTVFVNNNTAALVSYVLVPKVDGADAVTPEWASTFLAGADGAGAERFMLPYTVVVPITQGIHTVSQDLGPFTGTADFFFNQQNLVVVFYPENQGFINQNATPASTDSLDPMGD